MTYLPRRGAPWPYRPPLRRQIKLSANQPGALVELPWTAQGFWADNPTSWGTLYVRIGGGDTPSERNYDLAILPQTEARWYAYPDRRYVFAVGGTTPGTGPEIITITLMG